MGKTKIKFSNFSLKHIGDTFDGHFPIFIETRDLKISESPDLNLEESSNTHGLGKKNFQIKIPF